MRRLLLVLFGLAVSQTASAQQTQVGPFTAKGRITAVGCGSNPACPGASITVDRGSKDGIAAGDDLWVTSLGSPIKVHVVKTTLTTAEGNTRSARARKMGGTDVSYVPWMCQPLPTAPSTTPGQFIDTVPESTSVRGGDLDVMIARGKPDRVMPGLPVVATDSKGGVHRSTIEWTAEPGLSQFRIGGGAKLTITRIVVAVSTCTWATPPPGQKFGLPIVPAKISSLGQVGANLIFHLDKGSAVGGMMPGTVITTKTTSGSSRTFSVDSVGMNDSGVLEIGTASTISAAIPAMFTPMVCLPAQSLPAGLTTANRASPPSDVIFQKASSSSVLTQAFGPYQAGSLEIIIPAGSNDGVFPGAKVRVLATPLSMDGTVDHVERRRAFVYVQRGSFPPSPKVDGAFIPTTECLEL